MVDARYLGIGEETTFNTAVAAAKYIDIVKEGLKTIVPPVYQPTVATRTPSKYKQGPVHSEGDFEMFVESENGMGWLLKWLLGSGASALLETGVYQHTFKDVLATKSFTARAGRDSEELTFAGCKINKMTLNAKVKEFLHSSFGVIGAKKEATGAIGVPTFSTKKAFIFNEGEIQLDGGENAYVNAVSLDVDNAMKIDDHRVFHAQEPKEMKPTELKVSGDISFIEPQSAVRTKFLAGTAATLKMIFTDPTLIGATKYPELEVYLPAIVYETEESGIDKRETRKQKDGFNALYDPTSVYTIQSKLTNTTVSYPDA
jgi:hypothetical protein